MKQIVLTGDDFGLSAENNAGVITAYREGVLSCASLMVGGDAMEEAVDMARQNPGLPVGLHIAFADTKPVLPPEKVPLLVQSNGYFPPDDRLHQVALMSIKGRRQVRAEIAAQFARFHATGLPFDHVNSHRHVHVRHPFLPRMVFREAARRQIKMIRIPWDWPSPPTDLLRRLRNVLLRYGATYYGMQTTDQSICRDWNPTTLIDLIGTLPDGLTELFFHPTIDPDDPYAVDLPTLLDAKVKSALTGVRTRGMEPVR